MSRSVKVGIFIVGGIALFCVGIFLIGTRTNLFGSHFTAYVDFNNVDTLTDGASVRVGGMNAGQISSIQVPNAPNGKFRIKLEVDKKFRPIVRRDSEATIETQGMVGKIYINIAKGSGKSPECDGCTLPSQEPVSMSALFQKANQLAGSLQSTVTDIHHRADTLMQSVNSAAGNANSMLTQMKPNVVGISKNANAIVAGIRQGHGAAGKLLTDKTVARQVSQTVENASQASTNFKQTSGKINAMVTTVQKSDMPKVNATLTNAQAATQKVNKAVGSMLAKGKSGESTTEAIHNTIQQAQQTTANLADDTAAIKRNFFFRGFFKRRGFYNLQTLTPTKYVHTRFVQKPTARAWIPADGMFTTAPDGTQQLTESGRNAVDSAMSKLVAYLPDSPIVVEGYSTAGAADQQYLDSRQRALAVSKYLESHFHLQPIRVGIMPLGDHPPPHTGKEKWDGICLALVAWKK
jgi:phospholipid/cholesterol/gamma-HCH transport system substrate-binding protein